MWHGCSTALRLGKGRLALLQPHSLPWSEKEYAGSRGKCPPQAHPPLLGHCQVLETSECLAPAVGAKSTSIPLKAEHTSLCIPLSPGREIHRGWEQNLDMRAAESTHAPQHCSWCGMGPGVGREAGRPGQSPCTTMIQHRSLGVRILNPNLAFRITFQGSTEYVLFNSLIYNFQIRRI